MKQKLAMTYDYNIIIKLYSNYRIIIYMIHIYITPLDIYIIYIHRELYFLEMTYQTEKKETLMKIHR